MSILSRPRHGNAVKRFEAGSGTRQSSLAGHRSGNSGETHYVNASQCWRKGSTQSHRRSGQALIEFAFVSIVMVTLFTVAFSLGLMLLQSMVTANAGTSAGRILHHHPRLSPEAFALMRAIDGVPNEFDIANPTANEIMRLITADFTGSTDPDELEFTDGGRFGGPLYDERLLVLTREEYNKPAELPELNRLLLPNYIYDADRDRFRYPGAVVERDTDNALTVLVPLTDGILDGCFNTGDCSEYDPGTLTFWLQPLRICKISNTCNIVSETMPMDLRADGTFAITITFPAQAGALVEFRPVRDGDGNVVEDEFGNELRTRVIANDSALTNLSTLPQGYTLAPVASNPDFASLSTRGDYGLGELAVLDMSQEPFQPILVRPYRRVIEHSSTFRLGQRFEAMYQLSATDADDLSPLVSMADSANNFLLTSRVYDDANLFVDSTSAVATIPVAGKWRVSASVQLEISPPPTTPAAPWSLELRLYRNGTLDPNNGIIAASTFAAGFDGPFKLTGSTLVDATALIGNEDTLEVRVWHNCEANLDVVDSQEANWVSIESIFLRN